MKLSRSTDIDMLFRDASFYNGYNIDDSNETDDDGSIYSLEGGETISSHANVGFSTGSYDTGTQPISNSDHPSPPAISPLPLPPLMPPLTDYICKCCGEKEKEGSINNVNLSTSEMRGEEKKEEEETIAGQNNNENGEPTLRNDPEYAKVGVISLYYSFF